MTQWDVDFLSNLSLSPAEKEAWQYYQGFGYELIATLLYKGKIALIEILRKNGIADEKISAEIGSIRRTIKILDRSFHHIFLKENYSVFHGIGKREYREISKLQIGDIFQPKGFVSVTYTLKVAIKFSVKVDDESQIIALRLKKGQQAIFLGPLPKNEDEIVLPRNSKFHLIDKRSIIINDPLPSDIGNSITTPYRVTLYSVEWLNE